MKPKKRKVPCLLLALFVLTLGTVVLNLGTARADAPALSLSRLSIAAGGDFKVLPSGGDVDDKWSGVLALAYVLMAPDAEAPSRPRIALIARFSQPLDADARPEGQIGFRWSLKTAGE